MTRQDQPERDRRGGSLDRRTATLAQLGALLTVATLGLLGYLLSHPFRVEVDRVVGILGRGDVEALRDYLLSFGVWAPVISLLMMVVQALLAPIPAFLVVFANGLAFGTVWGWLLSLLGQTLAATVCFWIARGLGRRPVEAVVGRLGLESADRWFARWGVAGMFLTRLIPGVGFDGVSYAAGLTRVRFATFTIVTIVGSAPQLLLYAYLGQNAARYVWWLLAATVVVGAIVVGATLIGRRRRHHDRPRDSAARPARARVEVACPRRLHGELTG